MRSSNVLCYLNSDLKSGQFFCYSEAQLEKRQLNNMIRLPEFKKSVSQLDVSDIQIYGIQIHTVPDTCYILAFEYRKEPGLWLLVHLCPVFKK